MGKSRRVNWPFLGFLGVSLLVHGLVLWCPGPPEPRDISHIELSLRSVARAEPRRFPAPRIREKSIPEPAAAPAVPDSVLSKTDLPDRAGIPGLVPGAVPLAAPPQRPAPLDPAGLKIARLDLPAAAPLGTDGVDTAEAYFQMLNLKIQETKVYPEKAKKRQIEGVVRIQFTLLATGHLSRIRVVRGCPFEILNTAALSAVKQAAPFPRPPAHLFTPPLSLTVSIVFEII